MKVNLRAVNNDRDEGQRGFDGKSSRIESSDYEIIPSEDDLHISAEGSEPFGTGDRGGIPVIINRYLDLHLNLKDLEKIFAAAVKAKLIVPPGLHSLLEAKQLIEQTLSKWQG